MANYLKLKQADSLYNSIDATEKRRPRHKEILIEERREYTKIKGVENNISSLKNADSSAKILLCGLKVSLQTNSLNALFGKNYGSFHE